MATPSWILRTVGCAWISGVMACGDNGTGLMESCSPEAFVTTVPSSDTDWRAVMLGQLAALPADTVLLVLISYRDSVTAADRAVLESAGATLINEYTVIPGVAIRLRADALSALIAPGGPLPNSRVEDAALDRRVCLAAARPWTKSSA